MIVHVIIIMITTFVWLIYLLLRNTVLDTYYIHMWLLELSITLHSHMF